MNIKEHVLLSHTVPTFTSKVCHCVNVRYSKCPRHEQEIIMYKDYKDLSMIIEYKDTLQVIIAYTLKNTLCSYLYSYMYVRVTKIG